MPPLKRSTLIGSVVSGAAIVTVAALLSVPSGSVTPRAMALQPGPPGVTPERLATTLARVGLGAEGLAAVGATTRSVEGCVAGMRAYLEAYGGNLHNADQNLASATAEHDELLRLVQRGERDEQTRLALSAARADLAAARLAQETELANAFAQAAAGFTSAQRALLQRIHANRAQYNMPTGVAAALWNEADWLEARAALTHVRQAQEASLTADAGAQATVDDAMAIPDVATAKSNLGSGLAACRSAWDDAVATYGGT